MASRPRPDTGSRGRPAADRPKRLVAAVVAAALSIACGVGAYLAAPADVVQGSTWSGYRVLLADAGIPEGEVLSTLAAAGFKTVVSESTEPVLVTDWAELETTTLELAKRRLVGGDPRRDAYIDALGSWFKAEVGGKAFRAYYLPAAGPGFRAAALKKAMAPYRDRALLPDGELSPGMEAEPSCLRAGFAFLLLASAAAFSVLAHPGRRGPGQKRGRGAMEVRRLALRLTLALPWIPLALAGRSAAAVAVLFGLALTEVADSLDLPLAEYRHSGSRSAAFASLRRRCRPSPFLPACALLALFVAPAALFSAGLGLLGSTLALVALAAIPRIRSSPSIRAGFVPMPIASSRGSSSPASPWMAGTALAVSALWALSALGSVRTIEETDDSLSFPRPSAIGGSVRPGLPEARARSILELAGRLPDLSDWLRHLAIQEALPLERVGATRTDPFGPVLISRPGGDSAVLRFDDEWAREAYKRIDPASVEGMLAGRAGRRRPLAPIEVLRYIVLLVPTLGGIAAGVSASRSSTRGETRQEA